MTHWNFQTAHRDVDEFCKRLQRKSISVASAGGLGGWSDASVSGVSLRVSP